GAAPPDIPLPRSLMPIALAMDGDQETVALRESCRRISGEYIYIYPPGIPIVAPGEEISRQALDLVLSFMEQGLPVQGPQDGAMEFLRVVRQENY
ncbi:MAG: arginine decarboxylase, partial [Clostridium sp.]|nr:arginine decarboxylase [Clostridium sp.]